MEWPRRDVAQLQGMEQLANCPLVIVHLVFRFDPALDIHAAPADKPVRLGIGAFQHMRLHRRFLRGRQPLLRVAAGGIAQTVRSPRVETVDPVAQSLAIHAAARRSVLPARPLQNSRYCRQPQSNSAIPLLTGQLAQISRAVILPEGYRSMHGQLLSMEPPTNHKSDKKGIPNRVVSPGDWYYTALDSIIPQRY